MKTLSIIIISILIITTYSCGNYGGSGTATFKDKEEKVIDNGYGKTSSRNMTGSATELKDVGENIFLDNYLRRIAGVNVTGEGAQATITIRGVNSFFASSEPLFILNGQALNGGYAEAYNQLNSNDIKSITVLKDAASSGIYGSRAANGVIVIKLKNKI